MAQITVEVADLATRVGTEAKALRTLINNNVADLSALATTNKANLVAAINELVGAIGGAGASIDDGNISTLTVWSSDKTSTEITTAVDALVAAAPGALDTLNELAAALGDDPNFATTITNLVGGVSSKLPAEGTTGNMVAISDAEGGMTDSGFAPADFVQMTGAQTIAGVKTFSSSPAVPDGSFSIAKTTGLQTALDAKFTTAAASESAQGLVELATTGEVATGTDTARAVTPAGLRSITGDTNSIDFVATFEAAL